MSQHLHGVARQNSSAQPFEHTVSMSTPSAEALRLMERHRLAFLPVLDDAGAFAGIVLRPVLESACVANGHTPEECRVTQHLNTRVLCQRENGEPADPPKPAGGARSRRPQRRPADDLVIVLDDSDAPVGFIARS